MRTHQNGELSVTLIGEQVTLAGWVHRRRDHGGVIFVDLRDTTGLVQIVFNPEHTHVFQVAEKLRSEWVISVTGQIRHRPEGTINPSLKSGHVEVEVQKIDVLAVAETPPFTPEDQDVAENLRLRYRYLDLRRPVMQRRLRLRHQIVRTLRAFLDTHDFTEIETPCLTKTTPEGARDYLVPSRTHPGRFFALPQSPQLFKQLLMVGGLERYYQIARCFRDEDLRADRQPEFTQLDIETSFFTEEDIMNLMENMIRHVFSEVLDEKLPPFPRLGYQEALRRYGTDRPDLRNPLELVEISDLVAQSDFKVFSVPANSANGRVAALKLPNGAAISRGLIDQYASQISKFGARGLAWIKVTNVSLGRNGLQSPIVKHLSDQALTGILTRTQCKDGDMLFFGAGSATIVNDSLSVLRTQLAEDHGLITGSWKPLWVIDFPMFSWDATELRWQALHHPFTAPVEDNPEQLAQSPAEAISKAYDVVLNGYEIGGGSIRIHRPEVQAQVFSILGISKEEAERKFGFLLEALRYGAPPHGGIAFGLDRLVMLMAGAANIREVVAFPKTQTAQDLLTGAPDAVDPRQLNELSIRLKPDIG